MKLLTRISLFYAIVSLAAFIVCGILFYYTFRAEVYEELDEHMRDERRNIERILAETDSIPQFFPFVNSEVVITRVPDPVHIKLQRSDTIVHHLYEGKIPFRQWRFTVSTDFANYMVVLRRSLIDLEDLSEQIAHALFFSFIGLLAGSLIVNYIVLKRTFRPFHSVLRQLKSYSLDNASSLDLSPTSTEEFRELNATLRIMTGRIQADYRSIKEFSENASHEIQTPLAIIKNKLELLMQADYLREEDAGLIQSAYEAAGRLSRLNQALILLTRIENREFRTKDPVNLGEVMQQLLVQMSEQFALKNIEVKTEEQGSFVHPLHRALAEVLLSNLITNAARHTAPGGQVSVTITGSELRVSNPGPPLGFPPEKLFQRFFKSGSSAGSLGIGLSLVKKIAEVHDLGVSYAYSGSHHVLTLSR